jgi:uncharacterized protein (TIGR02145 family)
MKKLILIISLINLLVTCYSQEKGTFKDPRDGKVYKTVKIGTQWMMAENLAYKPGSGNFWVYDNNLNNVAKFGYLYDWETAKNTCPSGWHLPSHEEWTTLTTTLGGQDLAGNKLKSTTGWKSPNPGATNESGFTALPGGAHLTDGTFVNAGDYGYWWSSTEVHAGNTMGVVTKTISYNDGFVNEDVKKKTAGLSVRCVKD